MRKDLPGSVARSHTSVTDSISRSWGACRTIVVDPTTHRTQPRTPKTCSFSRKMIWASTALRNQFIMSAFEHIRERNSIRMWFTCLIIMLTAPSGVTRIAGANAYAAKLATSPTITVSLELIWLVLTITSSNERHTA